MRDPKPENIAGQKRVSHAVEHEVDWAVVIGALAALFVLWYLDPLGKLERDREDDDRR